MSKKKTLHQSEPRKKGAKKRGSSAGVASMSSIAKLRKKSSKKRVATKTVAARLLFEKRSEAAKKAAKTRKRNAIKAVKLEREKFLKRSQAAKKGAETRKRNLAKKPVKKVSIRVNKPKKPVKKVSTRAESSLQEARRLRREEIELRESIRKSKRWLADKARREAKKLAEVELEKARLQQIASRNRKKREKTDLVYLDKYWKDLLEHAKGSESLTKTLLKQDPSLPSARYTREELEKETAVRLESVARYREVYRLRPMTAEEVEAVSTNLLYNPISAFRHPITPDEIARLRATKTKEEYKIVEAEIIEQHPGSTPHDVWNFWKYGA